MFPLGSTDHNPLCETTQTFFFVFFKRKEGQSVARPVRISLMTKERWAQVGITVQFLIVVRTLGEFFRLMHVLGTSFSTGVAAPYVGGALIAACLCWASVTLYFFRRYALSVWVALGAVVILLVYKIAVIG